MKRYIGLRNIVTSKNDWKRLLFYEIDGHDMNQYLKIKYAFDKTGTSYVSYQTLNGYHFVGLTPVLAGYEGMMHDHFQSIVPEYFSGQTLRLSLKEKEKQELLGYSFQYPYLERLANVYINRLDIPSEQVVKHSEIPKYSCVFEKYWTGKI